jgi:uncharacterized membrane protein/uncharacterized RDD family membrane protein YckC
VVNPLPLSVDILANAISLALPASLWAFLFLLAWGNGPFGESVGFGRSAFWLLLPGALLATFALLPFAPVSNDWVAVSFGGALFPLFVGARAFGRAAPPLGRSLFRFLAFVSVEGAVLLLLVLPVGGPVVRVVAAWGLASDAALVVVVLLASVLWTALALALFLPRARSSSSSEAAAVRSGRAIALTLSLTTGVLASTFAASSAVPGVGIVEPFPLFLLPPLAAGFGAALLASRCFPGEEALSLPVAYFATTFGVLLGADLLRQPPLYGSGPAGLYTIGGAGVLDLVYLSGLLALAAAYLGHRALGHPVSTGVGQPIPSAPTPVGRLGQAFRAGVLGQLNDSLGASARSAREAAGQARRLLEVPDAPADRPWQGLPVPGWVVSDQANLDAVAREGTSDGREGFRGWLTARWLVYLARDLSGRRFGSVRARTAAYLIDLALVTGPAAVVWAVVAFVTPGDLGDLLTSVPFNATIYGFVAVAFLYAVVAETVTGTSPGKRVLGLVVRDRKLRSPGFMAVLVRNVSLLPALTVIGIGGALAVAFALKSGPLGSVTVAGIPISGGLLVTVGVVVFVVGGVGLFGALGMLVIVSTSERQRLGDLLAGTWVVRAPSGPSPATGASLPVPPPPPVGRSA